MIRWLGQYWHALLQALRHSASTPFSFLLNALVISVAFALPLLGVTALDNVRPLSTRLITAPEVSLFLSMSASREEALALQPEILKVVQGATRHSVQPASQGDERAATVTFKPREVALAELKQHGGMVDALSILNDNPLPDAYVITLPPFDSASAGADIDDFAKQLRGLRRVDHVQVDSVWVQRLAALTHLLELGLLLLGTMLAMVVVTVVFNTIRLQVVTQREEIAVSQLVGATSGYIARPFYYAGALLGGVAAAIALVLVFALLYPINLAVGGFAKLYASQFALVPLGPTAMILLLLLGALLGFIGALLSVSRHLRSNLS